MAGKDVGRLFALARRELIDLAIPVVVLLELERQWRNHEVSNALAHLKALSRKYESSINILGIADAPNLSALRLPLEEDVMTRYRANVASRLNDAKVDILPLPEVSHAELLARDLDGRLPFQASGKGYRDALAWEAIKTRLSAVDSSATSYLVTDDNDYGPQGRLDEGLAREIADLGRTLVRVKSIDELMGMDAFQLRILDLEQELSFFEARSIADIVSAAVLREAEDLYGTDVSREQADEVGIPEGIEAIRLDVVSPGSDPEWEAYDELDGTTILGEARLWAETHFIGYVRPDNYAVLSDSRIEEMVWEADQARILFSLPARLLFAVRVEKGADSVDTIEYTGIEEG